MRIAEEARFAVLPDGFLVASEVEGERLLAVAVLADALQLVTEGPDETRDYRDAWRWAFDSRKDWDRYLYSYHSICSLVHLDHVAVRERVWRMVLQKFPNGPVISLPDWPKQRGWYVSTMDQKRADRSASLVTRVSRRQVTSLMPCDLSVLGSVFWQAGTVVA